MKKLLSALLVASMLAGCATEGRSIFAPPVREVKDNVFYSDKDPKLRIEVESNLLYRVKFVKHFQESSPGWADNVEYTVFAFIRTDSQGEIDRGLMIFFAKLAGEGSYWYSQCSRVKDGKFITLGNGKYCSIDRPSTGRNLFGGFYEDVRFKGGIISLCYFQKYLSLYRQRRNISFRILYWERLPENLFAKFRPYYSGSEPMSKELSDYLREFDNRCMSSFEIKEY